MSDRTNRFKFRANSDERLVLSLDYEFIGGSIGFAPNFLLANTDEDLKGDTDLRDLSLRFFLGNWVQEIHYQKLRGFYLENTGSIRPNWVEGRDRYLQFPDLKVTEYGGTTAFIANPEFSLRSLLYNTEWQLQSSGSFIPALHYSYAELENNSNNSRFFEQDIDVSFAPGYAYSWVISEHWSLTPLIYPMIGIRFVEDIDSFTGRSNKDTLLSLGIDGRVQLAYNTERFIAGINVDSKNVWTGNGDSALRDNFIFADMYFGIRLNPPKPVKKVFTWVNDTLGL